MEIKMKTEAEKKARQSAYYKQWYQAHKKELTEKRREYQREYYPKWREKNRERLNEYQREWYRKKRARIDKKVEV